MEKIFREKKLTPQQRKIVNLLIQGLSNKEIAMSLGLSINTVKTYLKNLAMKLGVKSRLEIVMALSHPALSVSKTDLPAATLKSQKK